MNGIDSRSLCIVLAIGVLLSCGGTSKRPSVKAPISSVSIGQCADPKTSGVLSSAPNVKAAPGDLNGDGAPENVFADRELCRGGNCYWNLFAKSGGCERYLGTIEGQTLEVLATGGDDGFWDLRAWWKLPGGDRQLLQVYRFRSGGYRLADVMVCRQDGDNELLCASEENRK